MKKLLSHLLLWLSAVRLIPHSLVLLYRRGRDECLRKDLARWARIYFSTDQAGLADFIKLMTRFPEYRNLFYFRTGFAGKIFSPLCPPMSTLFISSEKIGPGLFIQHGFATIIAAKEIGENCWINQQVTIGFSNATDQPILGDNVTVTAGAKVIGAVVIGANSKVGANAVVVKSVPPDCTVIGVPARIVKRAGRRVDEAL